MSMPMTIKSRIDCSSGHRIKHKQLFNCNHVQCRWSAPAKVLASCVSYCLVVAVKTVACWWRPCFTWCPANSHEHNIYFPKFLEIGVGRMSQQEKESQCHWSECSPASCKWGISSCTLDSQTFQGCNPAHMNPNLGWQKSLTQWAWRNT